MKSRKFWFIVKYFIRNIFSADYVHIYLIYCLYDQRSYFEHICHYASCVIKQTYEICDKNISKKIYEKVRKYLFKMKEFNENILIKRFFTSIKRELCLTKGPLGNQEGQVKIKYPLIRICFRHFWFKLRKTFFQKGHFLMKCTIPGCFIFLK